MDNEAPAISVLHRDEQLLAVDKPSGLLVHRGWARAPVVLVDVVRQMLGVETVHPAHRLDRATSGVMLFALDPAAARSVARQFMLGKVRKRYLALVRGRAPDEVVIDHPIPRKPGGPRVPAVSRVTRLCTVETHPRHVSLVLVAPRSGRFHQVRRHLKHIDHPVIGDANYGKGKINRAMRNRYGLERLALHALALEVMQPVERRLLVISAPVPADLEAPLDRMGIGREVWSTALASPFSARAEL